MVWLFLIGAIVFEVVGTLTKEAAQTLGLPESVKVVAGAGDNAAAAVGTGKSGRLSAQDTARAAVCGEGETGSPVTSGACAPRPFRRSPRCCKPDESALRHCVLAHGKVGRRG